MTIKIFDQDIARAAARRAVGDIVADLRGRATLGNAYRELRDSPRDEMVAAWTEIVVAQILREQDRQTGAPPPADPSDVPAVRVPAALAAAMRRSADGK